MRGWIAGATAVAVAGLLACWRADSAAEPGSSGGLVYVRIVDGITDIARVRLSDGAVQAVTTTPERAERWPYWSDAAQRLVFQVNPPGDVRETSELVLWDPKTGQESMLLETPNRQERWPNWSPDGTLLVFAFHDRLSGAGVAVTKLEPDAAVTVARTDASGFFLRPSFSPNGRRLVAERFTPENRSSQIWILAAGKPPRALTDDPDWIDTKPLFVRDGRSIVYTRRPAEAHNHDIASIGAGGKGLRTIAGGEADEHSAWPSPTRDEIAFVSDEGESTDVFLADLDGGNRRRLREVRGWNELAPRWSPDGERVVVSSVPDELGDFGEMSFKALEASRILVLDREGNLLLDTPGAMADWMPPWP
jgi:Tol biopolymer transport system component